MSIDRAVMVAAAMLAALWPIAGTAPARAAATPLVCTVSGSAIAFGQVDVLPGTAVQTNGSLTVSCQSLPIGVANLYLCVALSTQSLQASGGGAVAYTVDGPGSSSPWSSTAQTALSSSLLTSGATTSFTAVLAGNQANVTPGSYSQNLTATAYLGTSSCTSGSTLSVGLSIPVSATVVKSCNVSATALSFGTVGTLIAAVDGQSALSLLCTSGTPYTVALNGGLSGATDPTARKMTSGAAAITYGLYQDRAHSVPWGTASSATLGGSGTATTQSVPIYGRVSVQSTPEPGTYSDIIVVTVTY